MPELTPEQARSQIEAVKRDTSHPWHRGDQHALAEMSSLYKILVGGEIHPRLRVDGTHVTDVPPREELDLRGVPGEDHEAAKAFHEATDGQNVITRRWLEYAAKETPIEDEDEAWAAMHRQYGQGAGPLVWDARLAYEHPDFPAPLKQFIKRKQMENDPNVIVRLAEWYRDRQGK